MSNQEEAEDFLKTINRKFEKCQLYSSFKDNILNVGCADKQLTSKYDKGFPFLSCVIDIFSKYAWAPQNPKRKKFTNI